MKAKAILPRWVVATFGGFAAAFLGIVAVSYFDVCATTSNGHGDGLSLASISPNRTHIILVRWSMGPYDPQFDMPGQYVAWTLRPFRQVSTYK